MDVVYVEQCELEVNIEGVLMNNNDLQLFVCASSDSPSMPWYAIIVIIILHVHYGTQCTARHPWNILPCPFGGWVLGGVINIYGL